MVPAQAARGARRAGPSLVGGQDPGGAPERGISFLGFRLQWRRQRGTPKWYVYTLIDKRPIRSLKAKIRSLTPRTSQFDPGYVLTRLNQVMHGWASYFRHAVAKNVFSMLDNFAWWRVIRILRTRHR
jgi:RNA-directed DNA polymerase